MSRRLVIGFVAFGIVAALGSSTPAFADSIDFNFYAITNNSGNAGTIAQSFKLTVSDDSLTKGSDVKFTFTNDWGGGIAEVYWDTNAGQSGVELLSSLDVLHTGWTIDTEPANPPGGNGLSPKFVSDYAADEGEDKDEITKGNSGAFEFSYASGVTLQDIIDDMNSGDLRLAIHVRSLGKDGEFSETFSTVPEPSTLALMALGGGVVLLRRRRKNRVIDGEGA